MACKCLTRASTPAQSRVARCGARAKFADHATQAISRIRPIRHIRLFEKETREDALLREIIMTPGEVNRKSCGADGNRMIGESSSMMECIWGGTEAKSV